MKLWNKFTGRSRLFALLCLSSSIVLILLLHFHGFINGSTHDTLTLYHPIARVDLARLYKASSKSTRYRNISHFVRSYKHNFQQSPAGKYYIPRTTHKPLSKTNTSYIQSSGYVRTASVNDGYAQNKAEVYIPSTHSKTAPYRTNLLPNKAKLRDMDVKNLLEKHSDASISELSKRLSLTKKTDNLCLELKPVKYKKNAARIFTVEELDISRYNNSKPLIPKIIHQTWNTYDIPNPAVPYVKSVVQRNPDWQYWFWTQKDIQCYLRHKHPDILALYNDYEASIFKTDVMRYFILYDYGGFYLDLDVECLKPLDIWTHLGSTILSHETYEHTFFGHMRKQPNVMTTVLATAPGHPYYKLLQEYLLKYHRVCPKNVLYSTGPFYIDNIYQLYVQAYAKDTDPNITVIHPRYWLPAYAKGFVQKIRYMCENKRSNQLTNEQRAYKLCETANERSFYNGPAKDSYLNHFWMNSNVKGSKFLTKDTTSIFDLVPNLRKVSDILGLNCTD